MSQAQIFASKVDTWLAAVLTASALISAVIGLGLLASFEWSTSAVGLALLLIGAILPLWILLATRYTLRGADLEVVCGPFRWRIPVHQINAVTPTRNPLSSPALSLDRLRIDYDRRSMMISPRDQQAFLDALAARRGRAA